MGGVSMTVPPVPTWATLRSLWRRTVEVPSESFGPCWQWKRVLETNPVRRATQSALARVARPRTGSPIQKESQHTENIARAWLAPTYLNSSHLKSPRKISQGSEGLMWEPGQSQNPAKTHRKNSLLEEESPGGGKKKKNAQRNRCSKGVGGTREQKRHLMSL